MATNVSEKDRTLTKLDEYVHELDAGKYEATYENLKRVRVHVGAETVHACHYPDGDDHVIESSSLMVIDSDGNETHYESLTVHGPDASFTIGVPTPWESEMLQFYSGYRHALAHIHSWIQRHLGYSGDMPTEVPNQSEGAGA